MLAGLPGKVAAPGHAHPDCMACPCQVDIACLMVQDKPAIAELTFKRSLKASMETLANLESFARSAEMGGFSAAARRLGLTPAAVSRNVAMLERNLGIRLFQRSTRKLVLTEAGERFLHAIRG